jgi:hypothetical protein
MTFKQTGIALVLLVIAAAVVGLWASMARSPAADMQSQHVLQGVRQDNHDFVYTESTDVYDIKATWPDKVPLPTAAASAAAGLALEQALKDRIDQFKVDGNFANLTAEDKQIQGLDGTRKYALSMEYKDYTAPGYHSYLYTVYADTLGAHPNAYFFTKVFDLNGAEATLGQVLSNNPNWLEELSLVVSQDVQKQLIARLGDSLPSGAEGPDVTGVMFPEGVAPKAENFQNFVINGGDLVIAIPPYQVASWAAGSFEVRVPLADFAK